MYIRKIGIGMSIALILLLAVAGISGIGTTRGESAYCGKDSGSKKGEASLKKERAFTESGLSESEKELIRLDAQREYERLKQKGGMRQQTGRKVTVDTSTPPKTEEVSGKGWNIGDESGMADEEELCKKYGIPIEKPVPEKEGYGCSLKTKKVDFSGGVRLVRDSDKINKKKKKKDKKIKLKYEDLVMTEEEEAVFWGYTPEEWKKLSDKEKYGKCDDSKANTQFGGNSMELDFE